MKKITLKILILALFLTAFVVGINAQTCIPKPANLVSWYRAEGNANDVMGAHDGALVGGMGFATGKVGQAFSFDGVDDFVDMFFWNAGTQWTTEAWVNASSLQTGRRGIFGGFQNFRDWGIGYEGGQFIARIRPPGMGDATASIPSGISPTVNTWYHVAVTSDGMTARIYVDGIERGSALVDPNYTPTNLGTHIGNESCCGNYFHGLADEATAYSRALSASEIQAIFNAGSAGKCFAPTTFTVNQTGDPGDGICDVTCTLRDAILAANANAGVDTIAFNILGTGPHTISPTSALPTITDAVIIDGYTQPGASANTNATGAINAALMIELNGSGAGNVNGLTITAGGSTVRGLVINRFNLNGIVLQTNGSNRVEGNFIGTNTAGTADPDNGQAGIFQGGISIVGSPNNTIGGTTAAARNLISGNDGSGIEINGSVATGNLVQGNYIGTNVTGLSALGNGFSGVSISFAPNNTVGGAIEARNVISANVGAGVTILGATGNLIQRNFIGVGADGTTPLGNVPDLSDDDNPGWGVKLSSGSVGNSTTDNLIAHNAAEGVVVFFDSAINNSILRNAIFANGGLGINLGFDGVTASDPVDGDTGPNNLQNYPVITSASSSGGNLVIQGSLNSASNTTYRVEFFSNAACDPSNFGEGQNFLGFANVTTDNSGNAAINTTLTGLGTTSGFLTGTATDPNNNTSEFSQCSAITLAPTAASVTISGRVIIASGRGIANARVRLTESDGTTRTVSTGAFGYYRFADVSAGQTVILEVFSKRFDFANPVRVMNVTEEITNADFLASP